MRTLIDQDAAAREFSDHWDGADNEGTQIGCGVYFARPVSAGRTTERKIVLE